MTTRLSTTPPLSRSVPTGLPAAQVTVRAGDNLSRIAKRLGVSVDALVQANVERFPSLATNRNAIRVGWTLTAPGGSAPTTAPATAPTTAPTTTSAAGWQPGGAAPASGSGRVTAPTRAANELGATLAAAGAQSIELRTRRHLEGIEKTGVGTYFGDHSAWKTMDAASRKQWLAQNVKPGATPPPAASIKESSCIGWVFENVGAAYAAAGKSERWNEIMRIVTSKGSRGTDLAKELKADGWQAIYWNPDAKNPNDGNAEHSYSALQVARGKGYYGVEVDAQVVNYRPTDGKGTKQDLSGIEKLKQVPFFFGLAKGGMHTFVGRQGEVNEFHWAEMPNSTRAIEQVPLQQWGWNSGLIMVPPGTWPAN
jgi:LysM repeat protein